MRTMIRDLPLHIGEECCVKGWVHRLRDLGGVCFLLLRDRSGMTQLVFDRAPDLRLESVISVEGRVESNTKAPGGVELRVDKLETISSAAGDLSIPINGDPEQLGLEAILDKRHMSLRNPKIRSIFQLQSAILEHFTAFLREQDFTEIKSSKIIGSGSEGGTGLFELDYFDRKAYLAQSPQLYKQTMIASGLERVFEIGAAYRAEKHDTPRHLNEYVSLDIEMAFIESDQELMNLERDLLSFIFSQLKSQQADILGVWAADLPDSEAMERIPRISYDEAKKILSDRLGRRIFELNPEGERELCDWALEEYGVDLVFVHSFPRKKRPFYTYPDGRKSMSFDLLFRGLEITSGGRRIDDYEMLRENIERFGMSCEELADYLEVFRFACPPHGGFAIGLERLTQKILGLSSIKEASLFPRDRKRLSP